MKAMVTTISFINSVSCTHSCRPAFAHIYIKTERETCYRLGPYGHGGWGVPRHLEAQESWWYLFQSEPKGLRIRGADGLIPSLRTGDPIPAQQPGREQTVPSSALSYSGSVDSVRASHTGAGTCSLSPQPQRAPRLETPSQTHSDDL